jgi:hypothetical protein
LLEPQHRVTGAAPMRLAVAENTRVFGPQVLNAVSASASLKLELSRTT